MLAQSDFVNLALIPAPSNVVPFRRRQGMSGSSSREVGNIRETIGATHAKVDLLLDQAREDRIERREAEERIWIELRALKHDKANSDMLLATQLQMIDRREGEMERRLGLIERPVLQYVEMRRNVVWLGGLILGAIVILWTIGKPFWDGFVARLFDRH